MHPDNMMLFMLVDALKRLYASQYKGKRSQVRAIAEYDAQCALVLRNKPEAFEHFCQMFGIDPNATGASFFGG